MGCDVTRRCTFCGLDAPAVDARDASICPSCAWLSVELLPPATAPTRAWRVYCPKDDGSCPADHTVATITGRMRLSTLAATLRALSTCVCGAEMVVGSGEVSL